MEKWIEDFYAKRKLDPAKILAQLVARGTPDETAYAAIIHCARRVNEGKDVQPWEVVQYIRKVVEKENLSPLERRLSRADIEYKNKLEDLRQRYERLRIGARKYIAIHRCEASDLREQLAVEKRVNRVTLLASQAIMWSALLFTYFCMR